MGALREKRGDPDGMRADGVEPDADALREQAARGKLLGRLALSLAHEARNPLNALAIHLEVLSDKLRSEDGKVPSAYQKNVNAMRQQVRRIDDLLRHHAEFATERGSEEGADLAELVELAVRLCQYDLRRAGAEVSLDVQAGRIPVAEGGAISQVLLSELLAGCAAAGQGGHVDVRVFTEGPWAVVQWTATGPGPDAGEWEPPAGKLSREASESIVKRLGGLLELSGGEGAQPRVLRLPLVKVA